MEMYTCIHLFAFALSAGTACLRHASRYHHALQLVHILQLATRTVHTILVACVAQHVYDDSVQLTTVQQCTRTSLRSPHHALNYHSQLHYKYYIYAYYVNIIVHYLLYGLHHSIDALLYGIYSTVLRYTISQYHQHNSANTTIYILFLPYSYPIMNSPTNFTVIITNFQL